jgi:GNAT superfamily N-acetyltransferase
VSGGDPLPIRRLTLADLPACLALAVSRNWGAEERKWRLLFDVGEVYGMQDESGELVATVVLTRYPPDSGVISMVLVAERLERRGLGTLLMRHVLDLADRGPIHLYATANGRPLYDRLGFVEIDGMTTRVGSLASAGAGSSRLAREADLPAILALDAAAFGADRSDLVVRLPAFAEQLRVIEHASVVTGYAGVWRNMETLVVGPVIAADVADAKALIADLAVSEPGTRLRLDIDHRHAGLHAWLEEQGVPGVFDTKLMVYGAPGLPGDRDRLFLPVMQALG